MKKNYESPLIYIDLSTGDVIYMSDVRVDVTGTGWDDFDEGGIK